MTERESGELSAQVTAMENDLQALARDTREIRDPLLTLRGGMLIVVIGTAAWIGAGLATWIPALFAR